MSTSLPTSFRQAFSTNLLTLTKFRDLLKKIKRNRPNENLDLLRHAYQFSAHYHMSQVRLSGELYLTHPLEVAHILADLRMDVSTIATALLHDVVEDTSVTVDELREKFGEEIAHLVEGVTKISRLNFTTREQRQADNVRKMLLAMVDDLRVILVKLADRLHNMRTLQYLPPEKQKLIAQETLELYAPLAHRMGMGKIRGELEDLAFAYIDPIAYQEIEGEVEAKRRASEDFLKEVSSTIDEKLKENAIQAAVDWRIKRLYSIYQKMKRQRSEMNQVYDLLAVRIITESVNDCYAALGVIHHLWPPIPGRIKDFIAMPRPNLYQSLHTTVIGSNGQPFEVQIRTKEMHRTAEEGIAAHWKYKEGGPSSPADEKSMAWLRQLIEWQQELSDPAEFLSALKIDLYPDEVYTFTPKGKVIVLPRDGTTVDFAYAIHTEVGNTCTGARVNGKLVPLRHRLRSGDIAEIVTQKGSHPSRDWLAFVKSSRARNKIKHWITTNEKANAIELGKKLLEKESRRFHVAWKKVPADDLLKAAHSLGWPKADELYCAVGFGKISPRQVLAKIFPENVHEDVPEKRSLAKTFSEALGISKDGAIQVKGYGNMLVYRARCCEPIRGEEIVGYITRGKGVAVHSKTCPNVQSLLYEVERRIEVEWASGEEAYAVQLAIRTKDRPGLLKELTAAISEKTNIRKIETKVGSGGDATIALTLDIEDKKHLERLITAMRKIQGVRDVERIHKAPPSKSAPSL
ncbi:MAG: bifunctional (p)ppGpp synthetase/guanosine-3',5'-bis(diphosphate) 3'-pyrophosphohydrolase [Acidobacteria bacterium]|nr:bifunctional (p)ppGpp synthetase/guanosine-3',5'-bis(diphosphate) 3'-pyrophosphohydrolase [Acidobacteriota bacterium]